MGTLTMNIIVLLGVVNSACCGGTLLELIFGPRLGSSSQKTAKALVLSHAVRKF